MVVLLLLLLLDGAACGWTWRLFGAAGGGPGACVPGTAAPGTTHPGCRAATPTVMLPPVRAGRVTACGTQEELTGKQHTSMTSTGPLLSRPGARPRKENPMLSRNPRRAGSGLAVLVRHNLPLMKRETGPLLSG